MPHVGFFHFILFYFINVYLFYTPTTVSLPSSTTVPPPLYHLPSSPYTTLMHSESGRLPMGFNKAWHLKLR